MSTLSIEYNYTPAQLEIFPPPDELSKADWKYLIIPKGRRFGMTLGAAQAFIEYMVEGIAPLLWVDTIHGNIDRYFDRYFRPILKKLPEGWWKWNGQNRILHIKNIFGAWSILDFRSADRPDNIEGFGYKIIFLNEAGIILHDDYLYTQAILPMMMDYPDSKLIAAGVPKGRIKKDGTLHKFAELIEQARKQEPGYKLLEYTSFDNPLLDRKDIEQLIGQLSPAEAEQEVYGRVVDMAGRNPFAHQYDPAHHEDEKVHKIDRVPVIISIDFNLDPFAVNFSHIWKDSRGIHDWTFDEASIKHGSIPAMIDLIRESYQHDIPNCLVTGDAQGRNQQLSRADRASYFHQLKTGLRLRDSQIKVPGNPSHKDSRSDVNYILFHSKPTVGPPPIHVKINPKTCPGLAFDMKAVQVDSYGQIQKQDRSKASERGDHLDNFRYKVNTFWKSWIRQHQKQSPVQN